MEVTMTKARSRSRHGTRNVSDAVREVCLSLPEAEEVASHGSPDFRVCGKTFATYVINHHGDGHVALWLRSPPGAQQLYTEMEPELYFVPPYVGPKGWLGLELNTGVSWGTVVARVREAYEEIAPGALIRQMGPAVDIEGEVALLSAEQVDPFLRSRARRMLARLEKLARSLPETTPGDQFGDPVWKAGKRTFCAARHHRGRLQLSFWVGPERQEVLDLDARYRIPAYSGHNGWIDLDVEDAADWQEIEGLLLTSYRHFALRRMLKALDGL
jgi:predicted DNA-binding protein (MmcQ/YjbR family)